MVDGFVNTLKPKPVDEIENLLNVGYFVFMEETSQLMFQDATQKIHDISRVSFLSKEMDLTGGEKNIPKPYLIGENGEVKDYGANVLYSFIDKYQQDIIIFGAVNKLNLENFDDELDINLNNYDDLSKKYVSRNNTKRYYSVLEDAEGNLSIYLEGKEEGKGNLSVKIVGNGDENGNVKVEANGKLTLNQVDSEGKIVSQVYMDGELLSVYSPKIQIANRDQSLRDILNDLLAAIKVMTFKHPQGPTLPEPVNWSDFEAVTEKIENLMKVS